MKQTMSHNGRSSAWGGGSGNRLEKEDEHEILYTFIISLFYTFC